MNQRSLFDDTVPPRGLLANVPSSPRELRRNDGPATSAAAASDVFPHVGKQQQRVVALVRAYPDRTALELSRIAGDSDPRKVNRRLGEVERMGLVKRGAERVCEVGGRMCGTWRTA